MKNIFKAVITSLLFLSIVSTVDAQSATVTTSGTTAALTTTQSTIIKPLVETAKSLTVSCLVDRQDTPVYQGETVSTVAPASVEQRKLFNVKITVKNTGNIPWFSSTSGCKDQPKTFLGTSREQDRLSPFFASGVFGATNWYQGNRIIMKTPRVNPGEIAVFEFQGLSPQDPGIYREFYKPVIEGKAWLDEKAEATYDVKVGAPVEDEKILKYTRDIQLSINLLDPKFQGEKSIVISISKQRMSLRVGGQEIRNFPVSTGTYAKPTPFGTTRILIKQQVRVAGSYPHYIMPLYMMFRKGGYGIHALPSLANDRGIYWREALNHIGTRRSHGCVRLLPADAEFAYNFGEVGMPVTVVP